MNVDRRTLLIGGGAGVGLIVAFAAWRAGSGGDLEPGPDEHAFGNYIKVGRDGRVSVAVPQVETGQGIWTALPQVVADELGAAWDSVGVEPAPLTGAYGNPLARDQGWLARFGTLRAHRIKGDGRTRITAGSTSVRGFEQPMREAAAVARSMLVAAAAGRWNLDPSDCHTADGKVIAAGRSLGFGELAEAAANRSPGRLALRDRVGLRLSGKPLPRLDGPSKINGSLRFAGDVRLPGMLFAAARLAPPGGRLAGFSRERLTRFPGVRHVAAREDWIAVVADTWWAAERALKAANPRFTGIRTPADLRPLFEDAMAADEADEWFGSGDYDAVTKGSRALAATYYVAPSQHFGLETLTATARFTGGALEIWAPTLAPGLARARAASLGGVPAADVTLYPMPVGDQGGRAMEADAVPIAVALARTMKRPVQVTTSQSASQNQGRLSPGALMRMTGLPGPGGPTAAWQMRVATADGMGSSLARLADANDPEALGQTGLDGAVPPYAIANVRVQAAPAELPIAVGYMRGSPQRELCFANESFVDELARAAGMEPLAFRMSMLGSQPRLARCLQAAAAAAQWDGGRPGSTMGLAGCSAFESHIGLVAVASIEEQRIRVQKLVAAVDCGRVINSALVTQQIGGGLIWALGQATAAQPEWVAGMPRNRPMSGIALPRIGDSPEIVIQVLNSNHAPGGVSGLGTTVLAPAVANAIFAATSKRLRDLPFGFTSVA